MSQQHSGDSEPLTQAERDRLLEAMCTAPGHLGSAHGIGACIVPVEPPWAVIERIVAGRMARAWREGAITALDFSTRDEDGISLSLDLEAHPNPYEPSRSTRPAEPCCDEGMTCLECDPDASFAEYADDVNRPANPGGES